MHQLNKINQHDFVSILGGVYEHAPWVAEQVYALRPFETIQQLHGHMKHIVNSADKQQQKKLICNHPELAGRGAEAGELTSNSTNEQAGAGLNNCSAEELKKLRELNKQYREKFDFPFVIAVKQLTRYDILDGIKIRLHNTLQVEFDNCIQEIVKIAEFRLKQLLMDD